MGITAVLAPSLYAQGSSLVQIQPVDMRRVGEIAGMLPDVPRGFGDPIELRIHWDSLYRSGKFNALIAEADSISMTPFPELTEQIYMSYFGGKDSETSKRFIMRRRMLLANMIWAECLTNKGKYMPAILNALNHILNSRTWTFPAEDQRKLNYDGKLYTIGLSSSAYGAEMAQALYLLNSRLSAETKQQIRNALQKRVFEPTLNAVINENANKEFVSLTDNGNHNSVTLSYVTLAALAVIQDKQQRAVFATIAERYSRNFLLGYLDDGYCSEGIGYFSYGFGHYTMLRDLLWGHTEGKIDLFKDKKVAKMALFAPSMKIINNVYPAISDCVQDAKPVPHLMTYLNKDLNLGLEEYNESPGTMEQPALCYLMYYFPNAADANKRNSGNVSRKPTLRDYFEKAGVLTVRPAEGGSLNMGATLKGGHNAEQHNHNDIGSYTIVVGDELLTGDVGLATYTPKYFGKERYSLFKTTTSYGHNVPLINDVQQHYGRDARAKIIKTGFTADEDVFVMDISSAYQVSELKKLVRTFTYNRTSEGYLAVRDDFSFTGPGKYETALITRHSWRKINENTLEITGHKEKLRVSISSSGGAISISEEIIDEGPAPYTRIAITLNSEVVSGFVSLKFQK